MTVERYIIIAKRAGLAVSELAWFEVGDVIDVAAELVRQINGEDIRQAEQADFDSF